MSSAQAIRLASGRKSGEPAFRYDTGLLLATLFLLSLGIVMVTSSSITMADRVYEDAWYFLWRHGFALLIGLLCGALVVSLPLHLWQSMSSVLLLLAFVLLTLVLIPGIGKEVNGSMRWIDLGPVNLQGSEPVKLFVITYTAAYLVRHNDQVKNTFSGFIKPVFVVTMLSGLLLLEPDYGSAVVLFSTVLGMLFMAGAPLSRFIAWVLIASVALAGLAVLSPYRMQRLTAFMDPWQDPFNSGFQLIQGLIAFGRGEWFGVGLGSSVQKLFYLPEAHTDFLFAVLAEELGLLACLAVIITFFFIVRRAFTIASAARDQGNTFSAYMAYGSGLILGIQAYVNMGVNTGLLPTKGLTLPLLSYGNNSIIISCVFIALLLRVDYETRRQDKRRIPEAVTQYAA
ncbi:MAG: putative lipid II flippase FtsW [Gammaproteobacteria bacterium]